MLSEEELILVAFVVACVLLVLGIFRLIWPAKPRYPVRRPQPATAPTAPWAQSARDPKKGATAATAVPFIEPGYRPPIGLLVQGRYRIVRELEAGACGNVCLAEDQATGHRVTIWLLPRGLAGAPHNAQAVQRMGQSIVAASTAHLRLVRVLEFGEAENRRLFVAMELVEGRRLSEILSEGKLLDVGAALRLALDLGGSLETLHKMGLVHGALRPRNLMVLEDRRVKLMDVELAGLHDGREMDGVVAAKPSAEYHSPEHIPRAPVTEKTEIYASAVILYEMLCGVPAFQAATREAVLAKHLTETPAPMRRRRRAVPVSVERIVTQALDKQPEQQPLIQDVLNALKAEASGPGDKRAHGRRLFRQLEQWVERRRWSPQHERWRDTEWQRLPTKCLRGELGPVTVRRQETLRPVSKMEALEDPQRLTRWLAESQHMFGRVIPVLIEDRDRLRQALEAKEQESERLRGELGELRRDLGALQSELERLRGEQVAMAEPFRSVVRLLGQLKRSLHEIPPGSTGRRPSWSTLPRSNWERRFLDRGPAPAFSSRARPGQLA